MRTTTLASLAILALLGATLPAAGRAQDQPYKGKIDDVERSADNASKQGRRDRDHDHDDGGGLLGGILRGIFFAVHTSAAVSADSVPAPEPPGQGYLAHPYARPRAAETFVLRGVTTGRTFGNASAWYFSDGGSSLRAGTLSLEGAYDNVHGDLEYSFYREPRPDGTDYLHLLHLGVNYLPPMGDVGYGKVGLGAQFLVLGDGRGAVGPELDLGFQLFPVRPLGVGGSARVAALTWEGGPVFGTGFVDLTGHGSVFLGAAELMLGWRWTRVGVGSPFSGPTAGLRVWF